MPRDPLYLLSFSPQEQRYHLTPGSHALFPDVLASHQGWLQWLNTISSFAFQNQLGEHYTIRKERLKRGDAYWYAYRSVQGRTKKRYLGKTADLTLERLEEVSTLFARDTSSGEPQLDTSQDISYGGTRLIAPGRRVGNIRNQPVQREAGQKMLSMMPLLETKLHPPQSGGMLVERAHLLERLDAALSRKLTLLLAPTGSGKTTLIKQWLTARGITEERQSTTFGPQSGDAVKRMAWVSLDGGDNDPLRFWRYTMTACQRLLGRQREADGKAALLLLNTAFLPPIDAPPIDVALTHLLNGLADPSSGGFLVLDDYHVIHEARIHETFAFFIDHLPGNIHILLLSRAEPNLPLLRWRVKDILSELHGADLRFSVAETATFLHQTLPITPSDKALKQLDTSLEGWAAGLRLLSLTLSGWQSPQAIEQALLSLGERADISLQTGRADAPRRELLDYFVSELLETQPEPVQRFLLQTSVLGRLCAPLCDAVIVDGTTGARLVEGSGAQLEKVARAGLFLEAMAGPGGWYRYHALFAEAMRREATRRLGEEALRTLWQRASDWYEQEGLLTEAIDAALPTRDMERVARLIERFNERHFYEPYTMLHLLEILPESVLHEHPQLCLLFATELRFPAQLRFTSTHVPAPEIPFVSEMERARAEALLQIAEESWRRQGELTWIGGIWAHRALSSLADQEAFEVVVKFAQQALTFLPEKEALDGRLQMYRAACLLFVATEKLYLAQVEEARQMLLQAQADNMPPNRLISVDINLALGKSYLYQGKMGQAQRYLHQSLSEAREVHDGEVVADALLELAWLAFASHDLEAAERQTREALKVMDDLQPEVPELQIRATFQLTLLERERGEALNTLERLTELEMRLPAEWSPRGLWIAARLHEWQERVSRGTRRAKGATQNPLIEPLTEQERRVLRLLVAGWSYQDVAHELIISVNTVKYHVKHLYQKLGVNNRLQASEAARRLYETSSDAGFRPE